MPDGAGSHSNSSPSGAAPARCGALSGLPTRCSERRRSQGARVRPECGGSPTSRCPWPGGQQAGGTYLGVCWWPTAAPRIRPPTGNELSVPGEDRLGAHEERRPAVARKDAAGCGEQGAVVHPKVGLLTCRRSTCNWWRSTRISTSLVRSERRASRTSSRTLRRAQ